MRGIFLGFHEDPFAGFLVDGSTLAGVGVGGLAGEAGITAFGVVIPPGFQGAAGVIIAVGLGPCPPVPGLGAPSRVPCGQTASSGSARVLHIVRQLPLFQKFQNVVLPYLGPMLRDMPTFMALMLMLAPWLRSITSVVS